jgi:hypothetical protein
VVRQPCMEERPKRRRSFPPSAETLSVLGVLRYTPISAPDLESPGHPAARKHQTTSERNAHFAALAARLIRELWNPGTDCDTGRRGAAAIRFGREGRGVRSIGEESGEQLTRRRRRRTTTPTRRRTVARRERIGRVGAWAVFVGGRLAPGEMVEMGGGGRQGEESVTEKRDGVGGGFGEDRISPFSIHRQLPTNFPASSRLPPFYGY